ncbi:MAG: cation:proton antiporter [Candidatus Omnitrophota bacterium]
MKTIKWCLGTVFFVAIVGLILIRPFPFLFYPDLPYIGFLGRAIYILLLACTLCLYRIFRGPTAADRIVALDIFGIMIVGFCAVLTIATGRGWYIDIGIAWALQSFIATLALSKYLEGKDFDD